MLRVQTTTKEINSLKIHIAIEQSAISFDVMVLLSYILNNYSKKYPTASAMARILINYELHTDVEINEVDDYYLIEFTYHYTDDDILNDCEYIYNDDNKTDIVEVLSFIKDNALSLPKNMNKILNRVKKMLVETQYNLFERDDEKVFYSYFKNVNKDNINRNIFTRINGNNIFKLDTLDLMRAYKVLFDKGQFDISFSTAKVENQEKFLDFFDNTVFAKDNQYKVKKSFKKALANAELFKFYDVKNVSDDYIFMEFNFLQMESNLTNRLNWLFLEVLLDLPSISPLYNILREREALIYGFQLKRSLLYNRGIINFSIDNFNMIDKEIYFEIINAFENIELDLEVFEFIKRNALAVLEELKNEPSLLDSFIYVLSVKENNQKINFDYVKEKIKNFEFFIFIEYLNSISFKRIRVFLGMDDEYEDY